MTVAYAICINVFFLLCEVFVAFYSQIPEHMDHLIYLFRGAAGQRGLRAVDVGLDGAHGRRDHPAREPDHAQRTS